MIFLRFLLLFCTFAVTKDCSKCAHGKEPFIPGKRGFYVKEKGLLSLTRECSLTYLHRQRQGIGGCSRAC